MLLTFMVYLNENMSEVLFSLIPGAGYPQFPPCFEQ
jgi:hypothetical protein